jgi:hypothetical protein
VSGRRRCLDVLSVGSGRGPGGRGGGAGGGGRPRPGRKGRPEVEDTPDRWVPPAGERERGEREAAERAGWAETDGPRVG